MKNWHSIEYEKIIKILKTNLDTGLSSVEVKKRLNEFGENILPHKKKDGILKIFINKFLNPIILILLVTTIISFVIGEYIDGFFIMLVILLDAILGTIQEVKAENSADSLQKLIKVNTKVIRDSVEIEIDSKLIVVGDIVVFNPGDKISADIRLILSNNLTVDESILTGESTATLKNNKLIKEETILPNRTNMLYAGTVVITGRGIGVVVQTAANTEIGAITRNVIMANDTKAPIVIRMEKFAKQISIFIGIAAIILSFLLYIKNVAPKEIFFSVVALSISAIPEGLPVALTLVLSIASNRMLKKNVLVKKLNSVESLGSCTVIASDKTGTLTVNQQTAKKIVLLNGEIIDVTGSGYNDIGEVISDKKYEKILNEIALFSVINNEAHLVKKNNDWESFGDSIDIALLSLAYKIGFKDLDKYEDYILDIIPYESEKKFSAAFFKKNNAYCTTVKGSVEKVLEFCSHMIIDNEKVKINKEAVLKINDDLASQGYRIIAIASKCEKKQKENNSLEKINELSLYALIAFIDPIRPEALESIKKCGKAGIKVVMITGDHPLTSYYIAKELKILDNYKEIATSEEIKKYFEMGSEHFDKFIASKKVFSRVTPIQKLQIVESYKRSGEFVAVTGDGVNDAPAMKAANIGIAMGSGTDVAKETGAMIITDDNFLSIVSGIEEGRHAYSNVRKVIYLLISCGIAEILFFILSIIFNYPIPLVAVQLLWINLVTDGIQDAALAFEKGEDDVMIKKTRNSKEKIFNRLLLEETLISGFTIGLIVFMVWIYLLKKAGIPVQTARGYILILMVFMQNIHVLNCRSETKSAFKIPLKNNPLIIFGMITILILQIIVSETPFLSTILKTTSLPFLHIIYMFLLALPVLIVMEIYKKLKNR